METNALCAYLLIYQQKLLMKFFNYTENMYGSTHPATSIGLASRDGRAYMDVLTKN